MTLEFTFRRLLDAQRFEAALFRFLESGATALDDGASIHSLPLGEGVLKRVDFDSDSRARAFDRYWAAYPAPPEFRA